MLSFTLLTSVATLAVGGFLILVVGELTRTREWGNLTALLLTVSLGATIRLAGRLPQEMTVSAWSRVGLFRVPLSYKLDFLALIFAGFLLFSAAVAVIAVYDRAESTVAQASRLSASILFVTGAALSVILSGNLLTLVLSWTSLDLALFFARTAPGMNDQRKRTVRALILNQLGGALLLVAALLAVRGGTPFALASLESSNLSFLLVAGVVRLGVYPFHLALPTFRRLSPLSQAISRVVSLTAGAYLITRVYDLADGVSSLNTMSLLIGVALLAMAALSWLAIDRTQALAHVLANQAAFALWALVAGAPQTTIAGLATLFSVMSSGGLLLLLELTNLTGSSRLTRWLRGMRIVAVGSLLGVPLTLGFVGRWGLYRYAAETGRLSFLVVGAVATAFLVPPLLAILEFEPSDATIAPSRRLALGLTLLALPSFILGLQPLSMTPLIEPVLGDTAGRVLLGLVRTTPQDVGTAAIIGVLLPVVAGYVLAGVRDYFLDGRAVFLEQIRAGLDLQWVYDDAASVAGRFGRGLVSLLGVLEGGARVSWAVLLALLAAALVFFAG